MSANVRVKLIIFAVALGIGFYQVAVTGPGISHTDLAIAGLAILEAVAAITDVIMSMAKGHEE